MADYRSHNSSRPEVVTIQCEHVAPFVYNHFPRKYAICLGSVQIVSGVVLVILGIVCITKGSIYGLYGFAVLVYAVLAGTFGIVAGKSKGICQITTTMIFSILSVIFSCVVVVNLIKGLTAHSDFEGIMYDRGSIRILMGLMLLFASIEAVTSLVLSSIACQFSCFCCKDCCCDFDLTSTNQVILKNVIGQEQQRLLIVSSSAPGNPLQVRDVAENHEKDQRKKLPPPYKENVV